MRRRLVFGAWGLGFLALAGLATMVLWNWLMPALFDLPVVSYWQALGLLILSRVFFGRFRGGPRRRHVARVPGDNTMTAKQQPTKPSTG